MKRVFKWFRSMLFPPADASRWRRTSPYLVSTILFLGIVVSSAYAWEYTNSPEFCGLRCHSMPPEYTRYQLSPHARIKCVECHIGREFVGNQFTRKAGDIRHVIATISKNYEYPIEVKSMRPARETCERCHFPEKFSDDSQRIAFHYGSDVDNTLERTYLLMKTGGGTAREGLGRGIHWHINNKVLYYASDHEEQEIPFVKVIDEEEGLATEYVDMAADFDTYSVDESEMKEMDCITCHNRISHSIPQPEEAVDQALFRQLISADIPGIRAKAVELLRGPYESSEQAMNEIGTLPSYYQEAYSDYYESHSVNIVDATNVLKDIYAQSVFPDQKVDWDTHPDNIGHQTDPGCFRCHDGKHLNSVGHAIRLECNLCHAIPVVSAPDDLVTHLDINHEPQPGTHDNPNWIALHEIVYDENDEDEICSGCHEIGDFDLNDNSTFCSNSVCHDSVVDNLDLEVLEQPEISRMLLAQLPHYPKKLSPIAEWATPSLDTIHQTQDTLEEEIVCEDCHELLPPVKPPENEACIVCHGETVEGLFDLTSYLEPNPHDGHEGGLSCSTCHPNFGPEKNSCALCHDDEPMEEVGTAGG